MCLDTIVFYYINSIPDISQGNTLTYLWISFDRGSKLIILYDLAVLQLLDKQFVDRFFMS